MAKREVLIHSKTEMLMRRLGLRRYQAVGLLEMLWQVTAREKPRGNIGRLTNEEIAVALDFDGDAEQLVGALVACKWLDEHPTERLIVHDWKDHAPDTVKKFWARYNTQAFSVETFREISGNVAKFPEKSRKAQKRPEVSENGSLPVPVPVPVPKPLPKPIVGNEGGVQGGKVENQAAPVEKSRLAARRAKLAELAEKMSLSKEIERGGV